MFGLSAFDTVNDGAIKDTLNFDELLDDSADETLSALEGALCCDGKDNCCDDCNGDVDFEDEDDPEDADDYYPGEPIADFDDDPDPEEEEDENYDDIVDGTDTDEFIEGIDDDDDPEEFEDDEIGDIKEPKSKGKKKHANESAFDGLFTDDDIATEGSAFEPKMDTNNIDNLYFRDTLDIETDTDKTLILFDEEDDDEDEDDMGVELGLEGVGILANAALYTGAYVIGSALAVGTVMSSEKIASAINNKKLAKKGIVMRTPTEDELREFYSASLKAASAAAKSASSIIHDYNLKQNSIKYFEPKEKNIIKKMRKCKGALGIVIANIYEPNGVVYSKTSHRNYVAALEELRKKIASAVPAGVETYIDGANIFIFKILK